MSISTKIMYHGTEKSSSIQIAQAMGIFTPVGSDLSLLSFLGVRRKIESVSVP
jgi:hypothetical protein